MYRVFEQEAEKCVTIPKKKKEKDVYRVLSLWSQLYLWIIYIYKLRYTVDCN